MELLWPRPGTQIYQFRGCAASWFGTQILGVLITVSPGNLLPLRHRPGGVLACVEHLPVWPAAPVRRQRLGIFGLWIKWLLLSIITLGIYTFWVDPQLMQWRVEKTRLRVGGKAPHTPNWTRGYGAFRRHRR